MPIKINPCWCGMPAIVQPSRNPDNGRKGFRACCCGYPTHYAEWAQAYDDAVKKWNAANPKAVPHAE